MEKTDEDYENDIDEIVKVATNNNKEIMEAMDIIKSYGQIDGAHHKTWCLDQIARIFLKDHYDEWVVAMKNGEDGSETYYYDEGIAP